MSLRRLFQTIAPYPRTVMSSSSSLHHHHQQHHHRRPRTRFRPSTATTSPLEHVFIRSLVAAGICHQHRGEHGRRQQKPDPRRANPTSQPEQISREEYSHLVDVYPSFTPADTYHDSDPPPKQLQYPLAPRLILTPAQESHISSSPHLPPEDEEHAHQIIQLHVLLRKELGHISHAVLWETYTSLRTPRPAYLSRPTLDRLFRHLAWTEFKSTPDAMQRYFALLNEVLTTFPSTPLSDGIWNSAISFAGRWLRQVTSAELKSAVEVWMRMEETGVAATEVTFNILYDLAVRAGRFALAGTIEAELRQRGLPLNRYFRTSVIYAAGVRRDGEGVRRSFRALVDAGEIVDTGVMNCVILSLLKAGEAGAADSVFLRMKSLHEEKFGADAPEDWREGKALGVKLNDEARRLRAEEGAHEKSFFGATFAGRGKREEVQRNSPIAPDARTYRILIAWAVQCGELEKGRTLLREMRDRGLKVHGSVYWRFLREFDNFGGFMGGEWTARALEEIWGEVLESLEQPAAPVEGEEECGEDDDDVDASPTPLPETSRQTYITPSLALATVHAFYTCTGRSRMLEVWRDVQHLWRRQGASEEELAGVGRIVAGLKSPQEEVEKGDGEG